MQPQGQISPDGRFLWNGTQWVPYQAPAAAPSAAPWARPFESAGLRANLLTICLAANAAALVIGAAFDVTDINYFQQGSPSSGALAIADGVLALVYLLAYYGTFIPSVVFFAMWVHRSVRNMPALGSWDARWSPSGAVWRCFIPIFNLVHPLRSAIDAWKASDPTGRWLTLPARNAIATPAIFGLWWAVWLIGGVLSRLAFRLSTAADTGTQVAGATLDLVSTIPLLASAVLAIMVVRQLTQRQDQKTALIASGRLV